MKHFYFQHFSVVYFHDKNCWNTVIIRLFFIGGTVLDDFTEVLLTPVVVPKKFCMH